MSDLIELGFFERFNAWKSVNKNLRTLLAVGGWVGERVFVELKYAINDFHRIWE